MAWPSAKSNQVAYSMGDHFFTGNGLNYNKFSGSQQHKLAYFIILNFYTISMELERQSDSYCKQISFHVD